MPIYFRLQFFLEMRNLDNSLPDPCGSETHRERTKTISETNLCSKRFRLAIMYTIWIATLIPSNIIAVIFFFKNINSNSMEIGNSTVIGSPHGSHSHSPNSLDSPNGFNHISKEKWKNISSDRKDDEKKTFFKIPVCNRFYGNEKHFNFTDDVLSFIYSKCLNYVYYFYR